ncbi:hypothetical protein EVAR_35343_1 [Eumeta japonica]|uniref:Uncharacterized protein n=1 Tax=Eumeta variegata TaxID=151549 RepID=A0A4C1XJW2_EUMVA|nr:hypothetical protein EVAR_35343_1 [Eumeta japonica]
MGARRTATRAVYSTQWVQGGRRRGAVYSAVSMGAGRTATRCEKCTLMGARRTATRRCIFSRFNGCKEDGDAALYILRTMGEEDSDAALYIPQF